MPRTVLIADPDVTTLELATAVLTRNGFRVESTNDGGDALARFLESSPCLVICDADLLSLSGGQLCRHIRDQSSDVRMILLRGGSEESSSDPCAEIGCDAVLSRPFRFEPIKELLIEWELLEEEAPDKSGNVDFGIPPAPTLFGEEGSNKAEISGTPIKGAIAFDTPTAELAPVPEPVAPEPVVPEPAPAVPETPGPVPVPVSEAPGPIPVPVPETPGPVPVPVPEATGPVPVPKMAPDPRPAATADANAAPIPIPMPVPTESGEPSIELDSMQVQTTDPQRPTEGKGLPPSVPRVGNLTELSLPRLLFEAYIGTYSGQLHLSRKGNKRAIFFWAGRPVFVDSDQLEERLGVLLLEEGRITDEEYRRAGERSIKDGVHMGEALIELEIISDTELLEALKTQTEKKLVNTLAWRNGTYEFRDDTSFVKDDLLTDVHPLKVIWRGVHEHYELSAMMSFFSKLHDRYVVTTDLFPVQFDTLGPHLRDLSMTTWLNGKTTFEGALRSNDSRALEIAQALYVLLVTEMIRPSTTPGEPAPVIERKEVEAPTAPVDYRFLMEISDRIAKEYLRIKGKDLYTALSISRDATADAVEEAYRDTIEMARKDLKRPGLPNETLKRAREIIDILTRAHALLASPSERRAYDAKLEPSDAAEANRTPEQIRRKALFAAENAYREGVRLLEMLDGRGARKQFEQALRDNPVEPAYNVAIAQAILLELKSDPGRAQKEALRYITGALRLDPGNIPANLELAKLLLTRQMNDRARTYLERVLQRAPHHQKARRLLDEL